MRYSSFAVNAFRHCVRRYLWTQVRIYARNIYQNISLTTCQNICKKSVRICCPKLCFRENGEGFRRRGSLGVGNVWVCFDVFPWLRICLDVPFPFQTAERCCTLFSSTEVSTQILKIHPWHVNYLSFGHISRRKRRETSWALYSDAASHIDLRSKNAEAGHPSQQDAWQILGVYFELNKHTCFLSKSIFGQKNRGLTKKGDSPKLLCVNGQFDALHIFSPMELSMPYVQTKPICLLPPIFMAVASFSC